MTRTEVERLTSFLLRDQYELKYFRLRGSYFEVGYQKVNAGSRMKMLGLRISTVLKLWPGCKILVRGELSIQLGR